MKPEKKGQIIDGSIGLRIGCTSAYLLWGFSSPGGIVILAGFGISGIVGYSIAKKNNRRIGIHPIPFLALEKGSS